jgi:class 3 adenylate cyclase
VPHPCSRVSYRRIFGGSDWIAPASTGYSRDMVACPACGKDNPDGFAFCGFCGAGLEAAAAAQSEERKVVTVLFCDLVGFTQVSDQADPEDVRATLRPYHAMLRKEIERYGGTVEKFIGDAVMAVFGAPIAHEDDPERAIRAALRVLDAVSELNGSASLDLCVRIGINTGEAVVALGASAERGEGIVTGDVVNTASRLEGVAPVGGIAVGEATYRATSRLFAYEELEPATVKGKSERIAIWRPTAALSRFGVDVSRGSETRFVGRDDELEILRRTYARVLKEQSVQVVTIVGEPGVGKSRLVSELASFVDDQEELVSWRQGRCLPYGDGITFWALGEIVKAEAGVLESDSAEGVRHKVTDAVVRSVPDTDAKWVAERLMPLVGGQTGATDVHQDEAFTAWRRFLESLASAGPLIVVLEDVHWADPSLLSFLEHVLDWSTEVPMLVVCTARPEFLESHPTWGAGRRNSSTLSLAPLSEPETAALLSELLARPVLPAETQAAMLASIDGNPLFAEELVRMLEDRGIAPDHTANSDEFELPSSVQGLIAARLDTLPPEHKALLQDAAVIGKTFWVGPLVAMADRDETAIEHALLELGRKDFVRRARESSFRDESEYSFRHIVLRDVCYAQIPRAARGRRHVATANWIESAAGERVADHAEILAFHLEQALELFGAGDERTELEPRAAYLHELAGDRAQHLDYSRAAVLYRRAVELTPSDSEQRIERLCKVAFASTQLSALDKARDAAEEARFLAADAGNVRLQARALLLLASIAVRNGDTDAARHALSEGIAQLETGPPSPELAMLYAEAGGDRAFSGEPSFAVELSNRALEVVQGLPDTDLEVYDRDPRIAALVYRGMARCELGDEGGLDDLRAAADSAVHPQSEVLASENLADGLWALEGPGEAIEAYGRATSVAGARGLQEWQQAARSDALKALYDTGDWDTVAAESEDISAWVKAHGSTYIGLLGLPTWFKVLLGRGMIPSGDDLTALLDGVRRARDPQLLVPALAVGAVFALRRGAHEDARALVREAVGAMKDRSRWYLLLELPDLARVGVAVGETDLIEEATATPPMGKRHRACVVTARALVQEARGSADAATTYREAIEGWHDYGSVPELGLSLAGVARLTGDEAPFSEATEIFQRLGARAWLADMGERTAAGSGTAG